MPYIVGQSVGYRGNDVSLLFQKNQCNGKHIVLPILLLDVTIVKLFLPEMRVHIHLPQTLTDVRRPATSLSQYGTHAIVCLTMGHFCNEILCGQSMSSHIQIDNNISDHCIIFRHVQMGTIQVINEQE